MTERLERRGSAHQLTMGGYTNRRSVSDDSGLGFGGRRTSLAGRASDGIRSLGFELAPKTLHRGLAKRT
jgi:hypothetical protein